MALVVYAELVKRLVLRVPRLRQVDAADEHELPTLPEVLGRLAWVGRAVQPAAKHAIARVLQQETCRLDIGRHILRAAVEEQRVAALLVCPARIDPEVASALELADHLPVPCPDDTLDLQLRTAHKVVLLSPVEE